MSPHVRLDEHDRAAAATENRPGWCRGYGRGRARGLRVVLV